MSSSLMRWWLSVLLVCTSAIGLAAAPAASEPAPPNVLVIVVDDLGGTTNLAASRPEKAAELLSAWERLNREVIPPRWAAGSPV